MRQAIRRATILASLGLFSTIICLQHSTCLAAESSLTDEQMLAAGMIPGTSTQWPSWRGPYGNHQAVDCKDELVNDMAKARVAWCSEGFFRGPTSECHKDCNLMGSPIVAEDKVFVFYYKHTRELLDQKLIKDTRKWGTGESATNGASIYVEDRLHAMDFKTGKQIWDVVLPRKGLSWHNLNWGARFQTWYGEGKVFVQGTSGAVYAVNAKDGTLAWQSDFGPEMNQIFDTIVENAKNGARDIIGGMGLLKYWGTHVGGYIDGVCVFIGGERFKGKDGYITSPQMLYAFDAKTGERLWTRPQETGGTVASECMAFQRPGGPAMFLWGRKDLIAYEARTGNELWRVAGNTGNKLGRWGDYILATDSNGHMAAYKVSDAGRVCKQLWAIENVQMNRHQVPIVRDGYVFTYGETSEDQAKVAVGGKVPIRVSGGQTEEEAHAWRNCFLYACYNLETGELVDSILGRKRWRDHHAMLSNGRIYCRNGVTNADGKDFRQFPTTLDKAKGTEQPLEHPLNACGGDAGRYWDPIGYICPLLVDGYYIERMPYRVMCWDLRATPEAAKEEGE